MAGSGRAGRATRYGPTRSRAAPRLPSVSRRRGAPRLHGASRRRGAPRLHGASRRRGAPRPHGAGSTPLDGSGSIPGPMLEAVALPLVQYALSEDVGTGDITTLNCVRSGVQARAAIVARAAGIVAGADVARLVFREVDAGVRFRRVTGD